MANTIRIKRRASGGAGAPASLENAELAFNEVDNILYYGKGTGGAGGSATTIEAIGGLGAFCAVTGNQTIAGVKTFSSTIVGSISGNAGTATVLQTARTIGGVSFNGSANINLPGVNVAGNQDTSGNATTATTLATARNLSLTGDGAATLTGFNGSANISASFTLATVNSNVGQFTKVTVNAKGLVTAAAAATLNDISAPTTSFGFGGQKLTNLGTPTADTDAATKAYVDGIAQGLDIKGSVVVATTGNITLSGTQTIDGVAVVANDRVLVRAQTTTSANGIYVVAAGAWTRALDTDSYNELISAFVFVEKGTTYGDTGWTCTVDAGGTLGSTPITWVQFSGAGSYTAGGGLTLAGNQFSITNTGVTAAAYGGAANTLLATVNARGQVTVISSTPIAIANTQVSGLGTASVANTGNTGHVVGWLDEAKTDTGNNTYTGANIHGGAETFLKESSGYLGYVLTLEHDTASPAAADVPARVDVVSKDSGGNKTTYAQYYVVLDDPTNGSEDAHWEFVALTGGVTGTAFCVYGNDIKWGANSIWHAGNLTVSAFGKTLVDDADASAARTTLGLAIGTNVQAYNAALASIAGLTTAANKMIYATASNTYAVTDLSAFGRSLIDDADATAARTTLGLNSMAVQAATSVAITGGSITNLTTFDGNTIDGGTF